GEADQPEQHTSRSRDRVRPTAGRSRSPGGLVLGRRCGAAGRGVRRRAAHRGRDHARGRRWGEGACRRARGRGRGRGSGRGGGGERRSVGRGAGGGGEETRRRLPPAPRTPRKHPPPPFQPPPSPTPPPPTPPPPAPPGPAPRSGVPANPPPPSPPDAAAPDPAAPALSDRWRANWAWTRTVESVTVPSPCRRTSR